MQYGASAVVPIYEVPVTGGVDYSIIPDGGTSYRGLTVNGGLSSSTVPSGEVHAGYAHTETAPYSKFNIWSCLSKAYDYCERGIEALLDYVS
jgi:hypothetical protein